MARWVLIHEIYVVLLVNSGDADLVSILELLDVGAVYFIHYSLLLINVVLIDVRIHYIDIAC